MAAEPGNETLTGQQSLLLDASTGRRLVQHDLQHLPALTDGVSLKFNSASTATPTSTSSWPRIWSGD